MADEQPADPTVDAGMPEPTRTAETGEPTANLPGRWSGAAVVPAAAPRRSVWARMRERVTGPDPVTDEWAAMPAVDPWADQDTPAWSEMWATPVPAAEMPPTHLDAPDAGPATRPDAVFAPPTRLDGPITRPEAPAGQPSPQAGLPDAPGTRVDAPGTRLDAPGTRLDARAGVPAAAASGMAAKATDRANEVADKASEMADRASEMAAEAARAAAVKAEAAKVAVAKAFAERAERVKTEKARAAQVKAAQVEAAQVKAAQVKAAPSPIPAPGTYPPPPAGSGPAPMRPEKKPRAWGFGGKPAPAQRTEVRPRPQMPPPRPAPPPWSPPRPAPPPWSPPRPAARKRGPIRRWLRRLTMLSVVSLVLCCGAPFAYWQFPAAQQFPVTAVLPDSFSDLSLRDTAAGERAAQRLAEQLQAAGSAGDAFAGVYADGNGKKLTVFGVTGWRLTPGSDVEAQLERLAGQMGLTDVQTYDTGEFGVHESCGAGRLDGTSVVACSWADHGSLGTAVLTRRSVEESAVLVAQLRDEMLTPVWRS